MLKKDSSLRDELVTLGEQLAENPKMGTPLGNDVYKIRLSVAAKGKGKSGGARIISFVKIVDETVYLLSIYNKGENDNMTEQEIKQLLEKYL